MTVNYPHHIHFIKNEENVVVVLFSGKIVFSTTFNKKIKLNSQKQNGDKCRII